MDNIRAKVHSPLPMTNNYGCLRPYGRDASLSSFPHSSNLVMGLFKREVTRTDPYSGVVVVVYCMEVFVKVEVLNLKIIYITITLVGTLVSHRYNIFCFLVGACGYFEICKNVLLIKCNGGSIHVL